MGVYALKNQTNSKSQKIKFLICKNQNSKNDNARILGICQDLGDCNKQNPMIFWLKWQTVDNSQFFSEILA